jgi:Icc-related predicted phosphoesterase
LRCLFASDLHGHPDRYQKLFERIEDERPAAVFLGGDLLPAPFARWNLADAPGADFVRDFLAAGFERLRARLAAGYPEVFLILGNDDGRADEPSLVESDSQGLWHYAHGRRFTLSRWSVYGYSYVPPTPFLLKDWERYDVSRFVDPGCVSPEEGHRSHPLPAQELRDATIQKDLEALTHQAVLDEAIFLFHSPPYQTRLDRAALDGKFVDHVPLDVHVGSIAIQRFLRARQPLIGLHGHVHESTRLTGDWRDAIGRTHLFQAAHDGPELCLIRFDPERPEAASRQLI